MRIAKWEKRMRNRIYIYIGRWRGGLVSEGEYRWYKKKRRR